jgi:1-deoxy-D-xylulose-5-phosphate reductoisomerase
VLNASNEVAVQAFLDDRIPFTGIAEIVERALDAHETRPVRHFTDLYRADAEARAESEDLIGTVAA